MPKPAALLYALPLSMLLVLPASASPEVRITGKVNESCTMIKEVDCTSHKREGEKACEERLKKLAKEEGADTLIIEAVEQTKQRKPSLSGVKTVTETSMSGKLYQCHTGNEISHSRRNASDQTGQDSASKEAMGNSHKKHSGKTIEERLIQLNALKEKGLITEDEYQSKRTEILGDL